MKYSVGEIANLLGISIVAVRNYEKCGLIEPERNEQNNYREYNAIDLNLIRRARSYMSYGFSMSEATEILLEDDLGGLSRELAEKEKSIEQELIRQYHLLSFTRQHAAYLRRLSVCEGECTIEMSPSFYGFPYREGVQISEDKALHERVRVWNDIRPVAETLLVYRAEEFTKGVKQYQSGLCMEEQYAQLFGIVEDEYVRRYPARKAVHAMVSRTFEPDLENWDSNLDRVVDWIRERGLTITDDIFGRVLHTSKSSGRWLHHIEIWAPIE